MKWKGYLTFRKKNPRDIVVISDGEELKFISIYLRKKKNSKRYNNGLIFLKKESTFGDPTTLFYSYDNKSSIILSVTHRSREVIEGMFEYKNNLKSASKRGEFSLVNYIKS